MNLKINKRYLENADLEANEHSVVIWNAIYKKEYLIDKKIPSPLRATLPLIAQEHTILYIAGTMIGEEVKVLQNTKAVYCIVWRPNTLQ